jgi:nitroreductase
MKPTTSRRHLLESTMLLGAGAVMARPPQSAAAPANPTLETLRSLRTIHGNFLEKPIPDSALEEILQATVRTANASNMQSYSIVVVKDRRKMKELCGYAGGCLLLYCADYTRLKAAAGALGHPYVPDGMVSFVTAALNATLAAQTAVVAAKAQGIDSQLTNGIHRGDMERVWRLLELPKTHCFPLIALVLGYAAQEPAYRTGRLSGPGVIHQEKYRALTKEETAAIIAQYDDPKLHLALNEDWRKTHKHYLDWFFQVWVGRGGPAQQESQMLKLLMRGNFVG